MGKLIVAVLVGVGLVIWEKEDKRSQWSNATAVLYCILTTAGMLYIVNQLGWEPSPKTRVSHWLNRQMFDVKEISDRRTNFSFEVTNRRDGRQFYVGNRKGFDDYILIQALLDPEKLVPRVTILDKDAYSKLTRRLQAEMARKGVFYETLDNPLGEVKLAKTLVASTLTEEKLIEAIWDAIAATIILRAEIGIALDK